MAPSLESQGTLLSCQSLQSMSYGWTNGSLMLLSVPVTYHVTEKWDSDSKYLYDMPYWTKTVSTPHPSNQPPEPVSNAHHSLMSMINPSVGPL